MLVVWHKNAEPAYDADWFTHNLGNTVLSLLLAYEKFGSNIEHTFNE